MLRSTTRWLVVLATLSSFFQAPAWAVDFPNQPVTIVVPFSPGGAGDLTTRIFAKKMTEMYKQPVVIINRPGAGHANSATMVAHSRPDGYTVFLGGTGTAISSLLFKSLPYKITDFKRVSTMAFFDLVLVVDQGSPFKSVNDVIQYAKAHPGSLNVGTVTVGSMQNLAANLFKATAGVNLQVVPFSSSTDVIAALRGQDIQVAIEIIPAVIGQISSKQLRPLAVTSLTRFPGLPDVPTLDESGLRGFEATSYSGLLVPSGTPDAVVNKLYEEAAAVLSSPDVKEKMQTLGAVAQACTPTEMVQRGNDDLKKWKAVIDRAGIGNQ